jgi:hypothetical protein
VPVDFPLLTGCGDRTGGKPLQAPGINTTLGFIAACTSAKGRLWLIRGQQLLEDLRIGPKGPRGRGRSPGAEPQGQRAKETGISRGTVTAPAVIVKGKVSRNPLQPASSPCGGQLSLTGMAVEKLNPQKVPRKTLR